MQTISLTAAGLLAITLLAGCNNAKSPEAVANDTAAAQQKAASSVADAQKDAAQDNAKMEAKVDDNPPCIDAPAPTDAP